MPEPQLLWIHKDTKTFQANRKLPAAQASIVNADSQRHVNAARTFASSRALKNSSAAKDLFGWKRQCNESDKAPHQELGNVYPDERNLQQELGTGFSIALVQKIVLARFPPHICGKDMALDPFGSTATKIDPEKYGLLQFFFARVNAVTWALKSQGLSHEHSDLVTVTTVKSCITDSACLYAVLALTALYKHFLGNGDFKSQRGAIYLQNALIAVRAELQRKSFVRSTMVHDILIMTICAEHLDDCAGCTAHLRAAKFLADQGGGLVCSERWAVGLIFRVDLSQAIQICSPPLFISPLGPLTIPILESTVHAEIEQQTGGYGSTSKSSTSG